MGQWFYHVWCDNAIIAIWPIWFAINIGNMMLPRSRTCRCMSLHQPLPHTRPPAIWLETQNSYRRSILNLQISQMLWCLKVKPPNFCILVFGSQFLNHLQWIPDVDIRGWARGEATLFHHRQTTVSCRKRLLSNLDLSNIWYIRICDSPESSCM